MGINGYHNFAHVENVRRGIAGDTGQDGLVVVIAAGYMVQIHFDIGINLVELRRNLLLNGDFFRQAPEGESDFTLHGVYAIIGGLGIRIRRVRFLRLSGSLAACGEAQQQHERKDKR